MVIGRDDCHNVIVETPFFLAVYKGFLELCQVTIHFFSL